MNLEKEVAHIISLGPFNLFTNPNYLPYYTKFRISEHIEHSWRKRPPAYRKRLHRGGWSELDCTEVHYMKNRAHCYVSHITMRAPT